MEIAQEVKIPWANSKEDFMLRITDGEWIITKNNELKHLGDSELESDYDVKNSILLYGLALHHTSDWLRLFCEEHHPEVDFDKEFETDKLGVFGRYQEKYDHDYEDWFAQKKYDRLKEELAKIGYRLPWK
jgi:hypothetical protein